MKILYCSSLVADDLFGDLFKRGLTLDYTGQKYHGLFVRGLADNVGAGNVFALSQPPTSKFFFQIKGEQNGFGFRYVPIIPLPVVKQLIFFLYSFCYTFYWCIKNFRQEKVIISSFMRVYQYPSVKLAALFFKHKSITVVCDIPWMTTTQVATKPLTLKQKAAIWMGKKLGDSFDGYVFLTETMNDVLNTKRRPYVVVEGFCDQLMSNVPNMLEKKNKKRVILYAGGLSEKYGILSLVEAVKQLGDENVELWLYGSGDMNDKLSSEPNGRIHFWGPKSNKEVVEAELQATVLINPRPTTDEYTHYSFPSKTLEYMVSGTYTMTTKLAGIPDEYFYYCGIIEPFDTDGLLKSLKNALSLSDQELHDKGMKAKRFVLENKNNITQTKRVIDFAHAIK